MQPSSARPRRGAPGAPSSGGWRRSSAARRALVHLFYTREVWAFRRFRSNAAQRRLLCAHGARVAGGHAIGELARARALWRAARRGGRRQGDARGACGALLAGVPARPWAARLGGGRARGAARAAPRPSERAPVGGARAEPRPRGGRRRRRRRSRRCGACTAARRLGSTMPSSQALVQLRRNAMRRNAALGGARRVAAHLSSRGVGRLLLRWVAAVRGATAAASSSSASSAPSATAASTVPTRAGSQTRRRGCPRRAADRCAERLVEPRHRTRAASVEGRAGDRAATHGDCRARCASAGRRARSIGGGRRRGLSRRRAGRRSPISTLTWAQLQRATNTWAELAMRRQYAARALADAAHFFAVVAVSSAIKRWAQRTAWSRGGAVAVGRLLIAMRRWRRRHRAPRRRCLHSRRRAATPRGDAPSSSGARPLHAGRRGAPRSPPSAPSPRAALRSGGAPRAAARCAAGAASPPPRAASASRGGRRRVRSAPRSGACGGACSSGPRRRRCASPVDSLHRLHCSRRVPPAAAGIRGGARHASPLCGRAGERRRPPQPPSVGSAGDGAARRPPPRSTARAVGPPGDARALPVAALRTSGRAAAQRRAAAAWRQGRGWRPPSPRGARRRRRRRAEGRRRWARSTSALAAASATSRSRGGGGRRTRSSRCPSPRRRHPAAGAGGGARPLRRAAAARGGVRVAAAYEQFSARRAVRLVGAMARFAENAARQARRRERRRRRTLAVALGRWVGGLLQRVRLHRVGAELLGRGARHVVRRMLGAGRRARSGRWVEGVGAASLGEAGAVAAAFWRWVAASNEGQLRRAQMRVVYGTFGGAVRAAGSGGGGRRAPPPPRARPAGATIGGCRRARSVAGASRASGGWRRSRRRRRWRGGGSASAGGSGCSCALAAASRRPLARARRRGGAPTR